MSKKAIQIPNAPAPVGPYSQAILMNGMYFVSGQIPLNPETGQLEIETIEEATHRVLKNIERLLAAAGMSFENVVKCSIFLKDLNDFAKVNEIYSSYFQGIPPARETVQVARLPLDVTIEISCIAIENA
jgi:2-iminobutanoate/2-iminopropanoate deaminase